MELSERTLEMICESAAMSALIAAGVSSGEISKAKATEQYGRWFTKAVEAGKLVPVRSGNGKNGKKVFSIAQILALRGAEAQRADQARAEHIRLVFKKAKSVI